MNELADLGVFILYCCFSLMMLALFIVAFEIRKSYKYRKFLSDMFVSSKIRQLAKGESLDLEEENKLFKKWSKRERNSVREHDLDNTIEEELKEKVSDSEEKKK